jgi:hypothetical protein
MLLRCLCLACESDAVAAWLTRCYCALLQQQAASKNKSDTPPAVELMQAEPVVDEVVQTEPAIEPLPAVQRRTRRPLGQCDSVLLTAYNQSGKTSAILTEKKATAASVGMHGDYDNDSAESENVVPLTEGTKTAAKSKSKRYVEAA